MRAQCGAMLAAIAHRGPDDTGIWLNDELPLVLGHRRLAVVELSQAGHQPMISRDARFVIVFNGEIYNHDELRRQLERSQGVGPGGWRGHSDTETLLECISAWGLERALQASVGMFALALWDGVEKSLSLARDRLGEKPLYYGWQRGNFLFGSELKALRAHADFGAGCNWEAVAAFLRHNYVPSPHTIYEGIRKVLPGTVLRLPLASLKGLEVSPPARTYWSLGDVGRRGSDSPFKGSFHDAVDQLEGLAARAVRQQSIADVSVGAFLSGGVDSSLVVALMKASGTSDVLTFSVGMPEAGLDESVHAEAVARQLGTRHLAHRLTPSEAMRVIPLLPEIWDEPLGDSSQIATYVVSRIARQHVTVSLSGDGGDELFLGYAQYPLVELLWRSRALGRMPWRPVLGAMQMLCRHPRIAAIQRRGEAVAGAWRQSDAGALSRYWADRYRQGRIPLRQYSAAKPMSLPLLGHAAATAGLWDAGTYLPDDILVKVDRAAMFNSLETRAPLLDHRIVEFALSLPQTYKLSGKQQKRVLRAVLYRHVPQSLVDRPKMGFAIPLASWLRCELREWVESLLNRIPPHSSPYDRTAIESMWQEHLSGRRDHTDRMWGILSLLMFGVGV